MPNWRGEFDRGKDPRSLQAVRDNEQTHDRWRQKDGGTAPEMAKELKAQKTQNTWLKKLVANQALDMATWPIVWPLEISTAASSNLPMVCSA